MTKFKKCDVCEFPAVWKVWISRSSNGDRYIALLCKKCHATYITDNNANEFGFLDEKEFVNDDKILFNVTRVRKL